MAATLAMLSGDAGASLTGAPTTIDKQSLFYEFVLMAETGPKFIAINDSPTINRDGTVAFQATDATGQGVWSANGLNITDVTPGFDGATRAFGRAVMMTDSGDVIESDRLSGSPPSTFIRIWSGTGSGAFTTLGRGGTSQPFDSVLSHPAVSANGQHWAFAALEPGSVTTAIVTPVGQRTMLGNQGLGYRPMVADNGTVVVRDTNGTLLQILLFRDGNPATLDVAASAGNGFTELGNQPGISDSGKIIAFSGNRGSGQGVFIAYEESPGTWVRTRVVGEGVAVQGNRPDLGFDDADNPIYFSSIDTNSRVAAMHQERGPSGLYGDTVVVAFIGTPTASSFYGDNLPAAQRGRFGNYPGLFFRQALGLWTIRLDFSSDTSAPLQVRRKYAIPVVQVGDTLNGVGLNGFTVASVAIHDPIAEATFDDVGGNVDRPAASHRIVFRATDTSGKAAVIRGTHVNSCLLPIRHYSQCDARWEDKKYVTNAYTFCEKACALTAQTMAVNTAADLYNIDQVYTPAQVHDFIKPRGGFAGGGVKWTKSVQVLRQPSGLLSLQPNALRFVQDWRSIKPNSSQAKVALAMEYIDDKLCDDVNPAGVVIGADREYVGSALVPGHFIVISGRVNDRYLISDPGYAEGILFSQGPAGNPVSTKYSNNFETRGVVVDPVELGGLTISLDGAGVMLVTDTTGNRSGLTADLEEPLQEIPGGTFVLDGFRNIQTAGPIEELVSSFHVPGQTSGKFRVDVIGTSAGAFNISVDVLDSNGNAVGESASSGNVALGEVKSLDVSLGPGGIVITPAPGGGTVAVPNVVGLTQAAATTAITSAGLVVGTVTQASSDTVPAGSVISQNPAAGASVAVGSAVDLVVSTGPAPVRTPEESIKALRELLRSMKVRNGTENSLDRKLQNALASLERGRKGATESAIGMLTAFINAAQAQSGKALTGDQAERLAADARDIVNVLRMK